MKKNPFEFLNSPTLQVLAAVERAAHLARWVLVSNGVLHAPALLALRPVRLRER